MDFVLSVSLLLLAEVFLLVFFLHQYQQSRQGYLKYMAAALSIGGIGQLVSLLSVSVAALESVVLYAFSGVAEMLFVVLVACAVVNFTGRRVNRNDPVAVALEKAGHRVAGARRIRRAPHHREDAVRGQDAVRRLVRTAHRDPRS